MIGGALAEPCESFPSVFARGTIWEVYPFLLPNLVSAATVSFGVIIGLLFLDETHSMKKHEKDRGRELGRRLQGILWKARTCQPLRGAEQQSLLANDELRVTCETSQQIFATADEDDELIAYQSQEIPPQLGPQRGTSAAITPPVTKQLSLETVNIFTRPVTMNIISYGILAL